MIVLPALKYNPAAKATDMQIDIETLSTENNAKVISLAGVAYNRDSGEVVDECYLRFNAALMPGHVSESTLEFWQAQDPAVFQEALSGTEDPITSLTRFAEGVFTHRGIKPWGNGSCFDVVIVENLLKNFGIPVPWKFWDIRDLRTLLDVAGLAPRDFQFDGDKHNALHDARHQTKMAIYCEGLINANRG